ncbi:MAG: PH domain-containing protein [Lentisphaeria bacterium]|nr:PH domain-containing protein [Lentisphaeria bacterium]
MKPLKVALFGCGSMIAMFMVVVVAGLIWLGSGPQGGVMLPNEMEEYATAYLAEHKILHEDEELLAYYDATMSLDGTEAAIVTTKRFVYHKNGKNDVLSLKEIEDVQHRQEGIIGDVFEIMSSSGKMLKVEVAPFNGGETFKTVLTKAWQTAKK